MSLGNSPTGDRPSVGRALQQARLDAKLSVEQVSLSTRVRIPIIHAIEQDDFSRCGGDVYARGHVRTLARAVGLAPEGLVEQFDAEHGGRPVPTPAAPMFEAERIRPEPRRPNWTAAMVTAILAVVGFVGFTVFAGGDEDEPDGSAVAGESQDSGKTKDPDSGKDADDRQSRGPQPSESAVAGAPPDKVTLRIVAADGQSWISAQGADGRALEEGVLAQGDSVTVTDSEKIYLVLGNAGGVDLFVNGKQIEEDFQPGEVERLTYTKGDPEAG
ncbi:helix-turn-helix domain-containing protein [Streptomyces sp. MAR4 CNX-425]|uniref:helix-turn-helix domain-containing protein n=1 Tax=Streptomyces sp. MAR4 CNX-425 TaxID=3406343 RepID=UPI003B509CBC